MVDNVTLSLGTADGAVIATDDIGGVHYQYNKIGIGAPDTFTILVGGAGNVAAGVQRVTIATDDINLAVIAALSKAEDAAHSSGNTGIMALAVREATPTDLSAGNTDGDYEPLQVSATGRLWVDPSGVTLTVASHAVTNAGTFVTQENGALLTSSQLIDDMIYTDDTSTHATGTSKGALMMAAATPTDAAVDANDIGALAMTLGRALQVNHASGSIASGAIASGAVASGAYASGAYASGSIASGAVASGAVASGAYAAGSIATGAVVDWLADDAAFTPASSRVMPAGFFADETATDSVDEGDTGAGRMTLDRKQIVTSYPHTAGGVDTFMASGSDGSSILVATKQTIKNAAGQLYGFHLYNPEAAVSFVHIYNTDTVTVGTTNPQMTIPVLAGGAVIMPPGSMGVTFSTAMSCAATTTAAANGAPSTGVSAVFWYK